MDRIDFLQTFEPSPSLTGRFFSLPLLEQRGGGAVSRLPVSIRIVLESVLRHLDGRRIGEREVMALANWRPDAERTAEVPFVVSRVLLQDFTGVPLLVDLAAMRDAVSARRRDPATVEPLVPVELVIDHSVQVDYFGTRDALRLNMDMELRRNRERYQFLKWGMAAFRGVRVVPPGIGICHQVNLEYLARGVLRKDDVYYPDTLVGTDSHTTMVNGLGVLGWGVGGIEAEAAMLGQPVWFLMPDVVGVYLAGALRPGVTATDLVLRVTELLRKAKVVGKFVEFFGEGARSLAVPDRATIANMAPEYGATCGFFPVDDESCSYLVATGRDLAAVEAMRRYYQAQGLFGIPAAGDCDYTSVLELDLATVEPSVAGPKRPQDRIDLFHLKTAFHDVMLRKDATGYGKHESDLGARFKVEHVHAPARVTGGGTDAEASPARNPQDVNPVTESEMWSNRPTPDTVPADAVHVDGETLGHGDVAIAAITSCTNTSNPAVMLGAGLLAKKAVERGLRTAPWVKTSLAPGSRVVSDYLAKTGLQPHLDALGFQLVGYGCTTCIGNSGPLDPAVEKAISEHDLVLAAVLSGNRNFEARVHQSIKANFLMSPPLVVAFAIAGRVGIDLGTEPLGNGHDGKPVYLRDIWPTPQEVTEAYRRAIDPETYRRLYDNVERQSAIWNEIPAPKGVTYEWDEKSTYIRLPPYFEPEMTAVAATDITGARALAIFGDSVTTDHISPAGSIKPNSPAGLYLQEKGVPPSEFNSYGARRGNHEVMVRGTFANVRIKNLMVAPVEGGVTLHQPDGTRMTIYDAALKYAAEHVPLIVIAGQEYGTGSSRDWAAKGVRLLGVRAVVAQSFERIHRTNLVGMGVLPCQLPEGVSAKTLGLDGSERYDLVGLHAGLSARMALKLVIHRKDGHRDEVAVRLRIDTPIEIDYFRAGGLLPYVLERVVAAHGH